MIKLTVLLVPGFIMLVNYSFSQQVNGTKPAKTDSTKKEFYLKGGATVTNKGISYIPVLSLGKPAIIFDLSLGNRKFLFEPQLRFAINTEPWSFQFPVRYKIKAAGKFQMSAGIYPLMNFKSVTYTVNETSITDLVNRRYLGGEFHPTYFITKTLSVGAYYLYFRGVSERTLKNTHFVSVNAAFSTIKFAWGLFFKINAQVYYLNQDGFSGYFFNPVVSFAKTKFPISFQTIMNVMIDSDIPGSEKFIWNVSLVYAFNKTYTRK